MKKKIVVLLTMAMLVCILMSNVVAENELSINKGSLTITETISYGKFTGEFQKSSDNIEVSLMRQNKVNAGKVIKCLYINLNSKRVPIYIEEIDEIIGTLRYIEEHITDMIDDTYVRYESSEGVSISASNGIKYLTFKISDKSCHISIEQIDSFIEFLLKAKAELEAWN